MDALMKGFLVQLEKSKLEAKVRARQVGDMMVDGIYENMVDLSRSSLVDSTNQQLTQQTALQKQSHLIDQATAPVVNEVGFSDSVNVTDNSPSKPSSEPEIILKPKESNTVLSPLPQFTLVPLTNKPNIVRLQSTTLSDQQQQATASTSTPTSSEIVKPKVTRIDIRNNNSKVIDNDTNNFRINKNNSNIIIRKINTTTANNNINNNNSVINTNNANLKTRIFINRNINYSVVKVVHDSINTNINITPTNSVIITNNNTKSSTNKVGVSKDSFEGGSKDGENNVEMVSTEQLQQPSLVKVRLYDCPKCDLRFIAESHLQIHSALHNKDTLKCGPYQKQLGVKRPLENRLAASTTVHKKQARILICEICSKQFQRAHNYVRHMATGNCAEMVNTHPYPCRFCERRFVHSTNRLNHEKIVHYQIRHFRCTWEGCQFDSFTRWNVVAHVGSIHFGVPQKEQRQMESAEADFGKYVRKVNQIVPVAKTKK